MLSSVVSHRTVLLGAAIPCTVLCVTSCSALLCHTTVLLGAAIPCAVLCFDVMLSSVVSH